MIDDRPKNIEAWENAGGIGILHKSAKHTIDELKKLRSPLKLVKGEFKNV